LVPMVRNACDMSSRATPLGCEAQQLLYCTPTGQANTVERTVTLPSCVALPGPDAAAIHVS
jgi:hypothetical protein